jgi:hypothetical protein
MDFFILLFKNVTKSDPLLVRLVKNQSMYKSLVNQVKWNKEYNPSKERRPKQTKADKMGDTRNKTN